MAAIFQLRRGSTDVTLADGELYLHNGSGSIQFGSGSTTHNLLPLNSPVHGDIDLIGNISASGDVRIGGNIYLGNNSVDSIETLGQFTTNLVPNGMIDIGTTSAPWTNVYANRISASVISGSFSGSINGIGDITTFSQSVDSRLDKIEFATASLQSFTSSQETKDVTISAYTASMNVFTSSQETKDVTISEYTASMNIFSASINQHSQSLNIFTSSQETKDTIISAYTASMNIFTSSTSDRLNEIELYSQSVKSAIDVTGGNVRILGDLIVDGNTTNVNTQNLYIEDKIITLASGSIDSLNSNGAGFEIEGANVSMSWEHANQRFIINTNLATTGHISASSIIGLNGQSVTEYSTSVDSRLTNSEILSASILIHISDINQKTGSFENKFTTLSDLTASYDIHTSSLNAYTQSVNGYIVDLNNWTASQNDKDVVISAITSSYDLFTASVTMNVVELFTTSSNHEDRIDNLETKSSTLQSYTASVEDRFSTISNVTSSYNVTTASLNQFTSSFNSFSVSVDTRLDDVEYTASLFGGGLVTQLDILNQATESLQLFSASALIRLDNLESNSASLNEWSSSLNTIFTTDSELNSVSSSISTSIETLSQSIDFRLDQLEINTGSQDGRITTLENQSLTFATTGSNTFVGTQIVSASMYVTGDLIVQGSSSLQNITASAVSIGTNIIYLNTDTPAVRFAGLSVFDSGSTGATGSLFYDSENERWLYQKSSGSLYSGGMLISGPRNTGSLGEEVGMTANRVVLGIGGDHISSSGMWTDGNSLSIPSNLEVTGSIKGQILATNGVISGSSQISGITNAQLVNSTISGISLGSNLGTLSIGTGLSGESYNGSTGVTISNTGVTSNLAGTGVTLGANTGTVTISIGQDVATSANVRFASIGVGTNASGVSGEIRAAGDITAFYSSDERLKENITPIENAIDKINQMGGYNYDWKEGFETIHSHKGHDLGVIAQEVQSVLPEIVTERETGYLAVDYIKLVPVLIEAIKELSAKIDRLENK